MNCSKTLTALRAVGERRRRRAGGGGREEGRRRKEQKSASADEVGKEGCTKELILGQGSVG